MSEPKIKGPSVGQEGGIIINFAKEAFGGRAGCSRDQSQTGSLLVPPLSRARSVT